jgi:glycosyltransferase involved in cell wall biosynthesis
VALVEAATWLVVMPTHNHPSTIAHSAASVLEQGVSDLELVIVGDGAGDDTRDVVADLRRADGRVSFFDRPKAPGRNEPARHAVVSASESPLVTYIGDDDLFLPHHLESMQDLLADHDFAHPAPVFVQASGELLAMPTDLADPRCVQWHLHPGHNAVSLTGAAHTGDLYRRLPFGWRTAPEGRWSDHYMWEQIFTVVGVKLASFPWATTVKLSENWRVGVDGADRAEEIRSWRQRIGAPGFRDWWDAEVADAIDQTAIDQLMRASELFDELAGVRDQLNGEQRQRLTVDHELEVLRGEHDTLTADLGRVTNALSRVTGTRTWRLRNRLVGSRRVDPMVAGPSGAA